MANIEKKFNSLGETEHGAVTALPHGIRGRELNQAAVQAVH